ncbi:endospore germination permease [Halobacillus sp. Nhm2S1]|uniref:GerAB/ArcD/ProY family transporter n=1 Tax=Halobacillus sp. Nhm2S1 TaxID=2866716 RepID=UPI001C72DC8A|nr:endospore germination permease [Halobacillus sp. Nhm2S1]MBX0356117.1 spore germination protein [Halobacillus sp. Nhm2S1]
MSDLKQLTMLQLIIVFISSMIGIGIILMPRDLANTVDSQDLWLSIIFGALAVSVVSCIYVALAVRYPGLTFFEMTSAIMGRFVGFLFNFFFVVYSLIVAAYILRVTGGIIKNYLLDTTPLYIVVGSFMLVSMYLIYNGAGDIVRFFQLYFPIMMVMFIVLCLLSIKNLDFNNVRPVFQNNIWVTISGAQITFFSFLGMEFLLIFSKLIKKKKAKNLLITMWTSIGLTALIYVVFHIISIGVLGVEELKEITFPTIEMAKSIEFQGFFFERFELIFLFGWLTTAFTSFTAYMYTLTLGLKNMFTPTRWFLPVAGILILALTLYPEGLTEVFHYSTYIQLISVAAIVILPALLLIVSLVRGNTYAT